MFEVRPLIGSCLHAIQALTVDQQWLLMAVDTNAPSSGSGMAVYCMSFDDTGYPHNKNSTVDLPVPAVSITMQRKPFSYQAKFSSKPVLQMFAFSCPPSTAGLVAFPPLLLLCLHNDGRLRLYKWINSPTLQACIGRYERITTNNNLKAVSSASCLCCSYSNGVTRALAFSHKRELYPVYWVVDTAHSTENVQFITAIPSSSSSYDKDDKLNHIKLPDHIKGICWPEGGDRIYVACSREYYCLFLGKDSVDICSVVKTTQNFTTTPTCSHLRSAIDKVEWSLLAFQLDSAVEVHASPLTKTTDTDTVYQLETQWPSVPSWIILHRIIVFSCYRDEQTTIECRLAFGPERGVCLKRMIVDTDNLDLASSCRPPKECGSTIILFNRKAVYSLEKRDPWDLVNELVSEKQYASALTVCEFMIEEDDEPIVDKSDPASDTLETVEAPAAVLAKIKRIRVLQATDEFKQKKEYGSAVRTFLDLNVEAPSVLRVICPGLTGGRRMASDVLGQLSTSVDPKAMDEIMVYLTERRARLLGRLQKDDNCRASIITELQCIDTALLRCYAAFKKPMISILLRLPNYCNCVEAAELLRECNRESDLLTMYKQKGRHRDALKILKQQSKTFDDRLKALVKYFDPILDEELELALDELGKLQSQECEDVQCDQNASRFNEDQVDHILSQPSTDCLSEFDSHCLKLLTNSEHCEQVNRARVVDFLKKFATDPCGTCIAYLEVVVYNWHDCSERMQTQLALLYISQATQDPSRQAQLKEKLASLLQLPQCSCDLNILLPMLQMWPDERANVFARLHQYAQAFSIWIEEVRSPLTAVEFVKSVDSSEEAVNCLFTALLSPQLKSTQPDIYQQTWQIAMELLDGPLGLKAQPATIVKILPGDLEIEYMCKYLTRAMRVTVDLEQDILLQRTVYENRMNQLVRRKRELERTKFIVDEESLCFECKKRLSNAAIARYPDGTVVHLGCDVLSKKEGKPSPRQ